MGAAGAEGLWTKGQRDKKHRVKSLQVKGPQGQGKGGDAAGAGTPTAGAKSPRAKGQRDNKQRARSLRTKDLRGQGKVGNAAGADTPTVVAGAPTGAVGAPTGVDEHQHDKEHQVKNSQANAEPGSTTFRMTSDYGMAGNNLDVAQRKKLNGSLPHASLGVTDVLSSASCGPETVSYTHLTLPTILLV